jgi:O-methyltransferase
MSKAANNPIVDAPESRPCNLSVFQRAMRSALGHLGYEPKVNHKSNKLYGLTAEEISDYQAVADRTMVWPSNVIQAVRAAEYIVKYGVSGSIVECGVWRGGVIMAVLRAMLRLGDRARDVFLYDTYAGLPPPGDNDIGFDGRDPGAIWRTHQVDESGSDWCRASLEDVREGINSVGYPATRIHFVKGRVEETIPRTIPEKIAFLRLDTDWYESTRHEMEFLFPRLSKGGVLIVDDYGTWTGARKAVDEYLVQTNESLFIARGEGGVGYGVKQ